MRTDAFAVGLDVLRDQARDILDQIASTPRLRATWALMNVDPDARALAEATDAADVAWLAADGADRAEVALGAEGARLAEVALAWAKDVRACLQPTGRASVAVQAAARSVRLGLTLHMPRVAGALAMMRLVQPRLDTTAELLSPYYTVRPVLSDAVALAAALNAHELVLLDLTARRAGITAERKEATTTLRAALRSVVMDWGRAQRRDAGVPSVDLRVLRGAG